jgi:hypothetical protein
MGPRFASGAITAIILTPAPLTATTDLTGSQAECLSALARGGAGEAVGVEVGGVAASDVILTVTAGGLDEAFAVNVALMAGEALVDEASTVATTLPAGRSVASMEVVVSAEVAAAGSTAAVVFMVVGASTVVADSTVVAAVGSMAVADTGNLG